MFIDVPLYNVSGPGAFYKIEFDAVNRKEGVASIRHFVADTHIEHSDIFLMIPYLMNKALVLYDFSAS